MKKTFLKSALLAVFAVGVTASGAMATIYGQTTEMYDYEYYQHTAAPTAAGWIGQWMEEGDNYSFYFDMAINNDNISNPMQPSGTDSELELLNDVEGYGPAYNPSFHEIADVWASVTIFSVDQEWDGVDLQIEAFYGNGYSTTLSGIGQVGENSNTKTFNFAFSDDLLAAWQDDPYGTIGISVGPLSINGVAQYNDFNLVEVGMGIAPVPEPATMLLFGAGLAGLAGVRRKKSNKA